MRTSAFFLVWMMMNSMLFGMDIKTAYQNVYPKFIITESNGKTTLSGLCIEIEQAIEKTDPSIRFIATAEYTPFTRIEEQLASGEIDAFCGLTRTPERAKKFLFTYDLYQTGNRIVARPDEPEEIRSLDDIRRHGKGATVLALYKTAQAKYLRDQRLEVDDGAKTVEDNLRKLMYGRGRFFYQSDLSVFAALRRSEFKGKVKVYPVVIDTVWQSFVFSRNAPKEKVEAVRKALDRMKKNGTLDRIIVQYFSIK